jgi:hypothetical protein
VVYAASGDIRPDDALADITRRSGPAPWSSRRRCTALRPAQRAPELRDPVLAAIADGGGSLFVSGVDPGWGNDVLPLLISGLGTTSTSIRCQEIFDYSTYDQPDSVRYLVGMGSRWTTSRRCSRRRADHGVGRADPADGQGARRRGRRDPRDLDRRAARDHGEHRTMGEFEAGTQGAVRFEVQGIVDGEPRIVIEHVTRIHPSCAPDWPTAAQRRRRAPVIIEGRPRIEVTVEATDEGENRSAGGNATAVGRLVGAIDWLVDAEPGLYDALDVPLRPAPASSEGSSREHRHPRGQGPDRVRVGRDGARHRDRRRELLAVGVRPHDPGAARVRGRAAADRADQRVRLLPRLADRTGRREGRGRVRDAVTEWRTTDAFDDRTRLAAEYAERYALDHHGLDDEFWTG